MRLFKYLEPGWANSMVDTGSIRIGTLHDYRRIEALGTERGDEHEGIRITQSDGKAKVVEGKDFPWFIKDALQIAPKVQVHFAEGAKWIVRQETRDMYVYCACSHFDEALITAFGGACVEIIDSRAFFSAVTRELDGWNSVGVRKVAGFQLAPCQYAEREQTWPSATPYNPVFRKAPRYSHQREVRAVWNTPMPTLTPINLEVPTIREFCRRMA